MGAGFRDLLSVLLHWFNTVLVSQPPKIVDITVEEYVKINFWLEEYVKMKIDVREHIKTDIWVE